MYPVNFEETPTLQRTQVAMTHQPALSAVLYSTGAIAVECLLAGVPCVRLRSADRVSINVLPSNLVNPVADEENIAERLRHLPNPTPIDWKALYSPPNYRVWADLLKTYRI